MVVACGGFIFVPGAVVTVLPLPATFPDGVVVVVVLLLPRGFVVAPAIGFADVIVVVVDGPAGFPDAKATKAKMSPATTRTVRVNFMIVSDESKTDIFSRPTC